MLFAVVVTYSLIAHASAYSLTSTISRKSCISMSSELEHAQVSGKRIFGGLVTLLTAATISTSTPFPAFGANYGGFGSSYSEVIDPKTAVVNEETFKSDDVKAGLEGLQGLVKAVGSLKESLAKDSQADISSALQKELSPGKIRSILNQYNAAFAEDTQRGTDRLIRIVIQDVNELTREADIKSGKQRSAARVTATLKRLSAAEDALKELVAFYPK